MGKIVFTTDLYTVSKLLGHANMRTTQIYVKIVNENRVLDVVPNIFKEILSNPE